MNAFVLLLTLEVLWSATIADYSKEEGLERDLSRNGDARGGWLEALDASATATVAHNAPRGLRPASYDEFVSLFAFLFIEGVHDRRIGGVA